MHSHDYMVNMLTDSQLSEMKLSILEKVELVSPITAAIYFYQLNQFHRSLANLLCHFAMKSYSYLRNCSISSQFEQMPHLGKSLSSINPNIFKFSTQSTRFRKVEGTCQFLEGLLCLGFWRDVVDVADQKFSASLHATYLYTAAVVRIIEENNRVDGLKFRIFFERID